MKVVNHPYLAGVRLREDGAVFVPANGAYKAHWTFGYRNRDGYHSVTIARKPYLVHRLMAESFLQCPIPDGMQIDHADRCPSNNKLGNIRIVTPSENCRNRGTCNEAMKDVVSVTVDKNAYQRAFYANNPEFRERQNTYYRERYVTDPEYRERKKAHARAYQARKRAETAPRTPQI